MKLRMAMAVCLLAVGLMFSRSAFAESWQCQVTGESDPNGIVTETVNGVSASSATTGVLIGSGGASTNRTYA